MAPPRQHGPWVLVSTAVGTTWTLLRRVSLAFLEMIIMLVAGAMGVTIFLAAAGMLVGRLARGRKVAIAGSLQSP